MIEFKRLLVVIDANSKWDADSPPMELVKALRLVADKSQCDLKLLCVAYEKYLHHDNLSISYDQAERRQEYLQEVDSRLQALADSLRQQGYSLSAETEWAYPRYRAVLDVAEEFQAELIIQHCRSYGKLEMGHLTNDSWQLVHRSDFPLLLVKNRAWGEPLTAIAAVDPMHSHAKPIALDYRVLDTAKKLQDSVAAKIHIVHAYAEAARPFAVAGTIEAEHSKAFKELMSFYEFPQDQQHMLDESPISALQMMTDQLGSDMLIMGAISRSRLRDMLIGSTTEQVLDFIPTDVLLLKPEPQ